MNQLINCRDLLSKLMQSYARSKLLLRPMRRRRITLVSRKQEELHDNVNKRVEQAEKCVGKAEEQMQHCRGDINPERTDTIVVLIKKEIEKASATTSTATIGGDGRGNGVADVIREQSKFSVAVLLGNNPSMYFGGELISMFPSSQCSRIHLKV